MSAMNVNGYIEVSNGKEDWTRQYEKLVYTNITEAQFMEILSQAQKLWPIVERWEWRTTSPSPLGETLER